MIKLKVGTSYQLSSTEQELIIKMAEEISNQDRSHFINNYKRDKSMNFKDMNKNGFGAELAFCKLCGIEFDSSTNEKDNHFNTVDATLPDGTTIDVKNTTYPNGKLLVRYGKEKKVIDMYVLMIGTFPNFIFSGWVEYNEIIKKENTKNLGYGNSYCLPQNKLNKELIIN